MAADYKIDWAPPDFGPGVSLLLNSIHAREASDRADRNAATQEEFARRNLEREEHRDYYERKKFEQGENAIREEAFKSARLLWQQGDKDSAISLLKRHGIESIPEMGQPTTQPAQVLTAADAIQNIDAQRAQQTPAGMPGAAYGAGEAAPTAQPLTALSVMQGMHAGTTVPEEQAAAPEPQPQVLPGAGHAAEDLMPFTVEPEKAIPAAPTGAFTFKGPEGQDFGRFDPSIVQQSTGFGDRFDAVYRSAIRAGATPEHAFAKALGDEQKIAAETGRDTRAQNQIDFRNLTREDQQDFIAIQNKLYKNEPTTAEEREKLARIRASAASAGNPYKQEGVNDRLFALLDRRAKAVRDTGLYAKLAANDKVVRGIMANLASGTEGLQHKDAQIQLARYFRQAQPTESEMHLLYDQLGGWTDSFNQFKAKVLRGDLSPEQLRQMKKSARTVLREHEEDKKRFIEVARSGLGPKSGLDVIPDQAQNAFDMMTSELGFSPGELPRLYDTEGGVTLGTKQAPKVQPRGTSKTGLDQLESQVDALIGGGK